MCGAILAKKCEVNVNFLIFFKFLRDKIHSFLKNKFSFFWETSLCFLREKGLFFKMKNKKFNAKFVNFGLKNEKFW